MNATYPKFGDYSTPDLRDREPKRDKALELIESKIVGFGRLERTSCKIHYIEKQNLTSRSLPEFPETSNLAADSFLLAISLARLLIDKDVEATRQKAEIEESIGLETQMWMNSDLSRMDELEPYDWGELDPETIGEPIDW